MMRFILAALGFLACGTAAPVERYGFVALLGRDTVSVESVTRRGNTVTSDAVDRFPASAGGTPRSTSAPTAPSGVSSWTFIRRASQPTSESAASWPT